MKKENAMWRLSARKKTVLRVQEAAEKMGVSQCAFTEMALFGMLGMIETREPKYVEEMLTRLKGLADVGPDGRLVRDGETIEGAS